MTGTLGQGSVRGARRSFASVRQSSHERVQVPEHPGIKPLRARKESSHIRSESRLFGRWLTGTMANDGIKRYGQGVRQSDCGTQRRRLPSTLDARNGLECEPSMLGQLCLGQASSNTVLADSTCHVYWVEGHPLVHSWAAYGAGSAESRSLWSSC